jgi:hypothetical protein
MKCELNKKAVFLRVCLQRNKNRKEKIVMVDVEVEGFHKNITVLEYKIPHISSDKMHIYGHPIHPNPKKHRQTSTIVHP